VATQNPYDALGTYLLPYAQIDRFMVGISTTHLSTDSELELIKATDIIDKHISKTHIDINTIRIIQDDVQKIIVSDDLLEYCVKCMQQYKKA
jgi:MoxR-like ATPase